MICRMRDTPFGNFLPIQAYGVRKDKVPGWKT